MAANVVSANYDELEKIAQQFATQQQHVQRLTASLTMTVDQLRQGGWVADSAGVYYRRMDQNIFPSMRRLGAALGHSQTAVLEIVRVLRQAEEEAGASLRGVGVGAVGAGIGAAGLIQEFDVVNSRHAPGSDGGWNGANPTAAKAIVVNGIQTDQAGLQDMMGRISTAFGIGSTDVMGVYNATARTDAKSGFFEDIGQAIVDKFQAHFILRPGPENPAVDSLVEAIIANDGKAPIIAHSQGGAITAAALEKLSRTDFDLSKLTVITMGSAEFEFPNGPHYTHYVHALDVVPVVGGLYAHFNPLTLGMAVLTGEVKFSNPVPSSASGYIDVTHGFSPPDGGDTGGYINDLARDVQGQINSGL